MDISYIWPQSHIFQSMFIHNGTSFPKYFNNRFCGVELFDSVHHKAFWLAPSMGGFHLCACTPIRECLLSVWSFGVDFQIWMDFQSWADSQGQRSLEENSSHHIYPEGFEEKWISLQVLFNFVLWPMIAWLKVYFIANLDFFSFNFFNTWKILLFKY